MLFRHRRSKNSIFSHVFSKMQKRPSYCTKILFILDCLPSLKVFLFLCPFFWKFVPHDLNSKRRRCLVRWKLIYCSDKLRSYLPNFEIRASLKISWAEPNQAQLEDLQLEVNPSWAEPSSAQMPRYYISRIINHLKISKLLI